MNIFIKTKHINIRSDQRSQIQTDSDSLIVLIRLFRNYFSLHRSDITTPLNSLLGSVASHHSHKIYNKRNNHFISEWYGKIANHQQRITNGWCCRIPQETSRKDHFWNQSMYSMLVFVLCLNRVVNREIPLSLELLRR